MTTSRHRAREVALQILYRFDLPKNESQALSAPLNPQDMIRELGIHFDHFQVPENLREFAAQLVAGTLGEIPKLDALLESQTSNWKVTRMSSVDRSLLRMAAYEMSHFPDTDASVVIDEAIELGKQFGTAESPAFINGVLDAIKTALSRTR
jgi:N utilization substance protein B